MQKFDKITAVAAGLPIINIDTDMIIPKQFLKTVKRTGLGANLFDEMRFTQDGKEVPDFVLNKEPYRNAGILVAGDNFGCGSSREHAPWSLSDFGIKCIIAPNFADIFYNNCFKNGILPIRLPKEQVDELMQVSQSEHPEMTVDLMTQEIIAQNKRYSFDVDSFRKKCLLEGLDDIGLTLEKKDKIDSFEGGNRELTPWLYASV
jgi:3-isopropylmalate/(R)-2-methylmalate dehydratase small subunit